MTTITVKIVTVSGAAVEFSRQSATWGGLNQFERDDMISSWVNENTEAQAALSVSNGYTLSFQSF